MTSPHAKVTLLIAFLTIAAGVGAQKCSGCHLILTHPVGPAPYSVTITFGVGTASGSCVGAFPECDPDACTLGRLHDLR